MVACRCLTCAIRKERERKIIFSCEMRMAGGIIHTYTHYLRSPFRQRVNIIAKSAGLFSAPGRVILHIEIQGQPLPSKIPQSVDFAVLVGQIEIRRRLPHFQCSGGLCICHLIRKNQGQRHERCNHFPCFHNTPPIYQGASHCSSCSSARIEFSYRQRTHPQQHCRYRRQSSCEEERRGRTLKLPERSEQQPRGNRRESHPQID